MDKRDKVISEMLDFQFKIIFLLDRAHGFQNTLKEVIRLADEKVDSNHKMFDLMKEWNVDYFNITREYLKKMRHISDVQQ